jgi:hypothetical protein
MKVCFNDSINVSRPEIWIPPAGWETDINKLRGEMNAYHNTQVHLDLCSGQNLNVSTSAIYLLGTDLQTTFCTHLVGTIITQAHMHPHVHVHTHIIYASA